MDGRPMANYAPPASFNGDPNNAEDVLAYLSITAADSNGRTSYTDRHALREISRLVHSLQDNSWPHQQSDFPEPTEPEGYVTSGSHSLRTHIESVENTAQRDGRIYDDGLRNSEPSTEHEPGPTLEVLEATSPELAPQGATQPHCRPHAAVEKRYRRTVNAKLQQLYNAIPPSGVFKPITDDTECDQTAEEHEQAAKPVVLDKAIQYVTHLIATYQKYDTDIQDLRQRVRALIGEDDETRIFDRGSLGTRSTAISDDNYRSRNDVNQYGEGVRSQDHSAGHSSKS